MAFKAKSERDEIDPVFVALGEKRKALGLSQREVGEAVGVDDNTIWSWESGTAFPRWENFRAWLYALHMDLEVKDETDG